MPFPASRSNCSTWPLAGEREKAAELYYWFLPLLRMDTVPKFVQLIKLAQQEAGVGNARVRPPRLELTGAELDMALADHSRRPSAIGQRSGRAADWSRSAMPVDNGTETAVGAALRGRSLIGFSLGSEQGSEFHAVNPADAN